MLPARYDDDDDDDDDAFSKAPGLEPHRQLVVCHIQETR